MWCQVRKVLRSSVGIFALLVIGCAAEPSKKASIGVIIGRHKHTGALHVRGVPPGLAGDKAGLKDGDRIKMIDGVLADRLTEEQIQDRLRGDVGSTVTLTIIRGKHVFHLEIKREPLGTKPKKLE